MSHERSDEIYRTYQESVSRLDHFVTGAALALVGYLGTRKSEAALGINGSTFELLALVSFVASVFCGVKRLTKHSVTLGQMHQSLHAQETAAEYITAAAGGKSTFNPGTGAVHSAPAALAESKKHKDRSRSLDANVDATIKVSARWFQWRDRFLMLGMFFLVVGRIVEALWR